MEYLLAVVKSQKFTNDMVKITTGANYPAIHVTDILNYEIAIPPISLQNKFAKLIKQKIVCENQLKKLNEIHSALMQEYFG